MTIFRIHRSALALALLCLTGAAAVAQQGRPVFPGAEWARYAAPESAGFTSSGIAAVRAQLATMSTSGLVVVVGGRVLFEHGDVDTISYLASARKSVLSMLYGIHIDRGAIDLDKTLEQLGIDDLGGLTREEKQAKVRHVLAARSGIYHAASNPGDDLASAPPRGSQRPGEYYLYSNWDFNVLGTIFEQLTRQGIYDALQRDIVEPIGMQDFRRELHRRQGDTTRSIHLAYHMHFSTRDMARIGYLMLRGGNWNGRQVVPAAWVRESTRPITPVTEMNPPGRRNGPYGYGYLWWVWDGPNTPAPFKGAYAAQGAVGQYIAVLPALDLVVAHKTIPGNDRNVSGGEFLTLLDLIVRAKTGTPERVAIQLPDSILRRYVGIYEITPRVSMTLTLENGGLFAQITSQAKAPIFPESATLFFYKAVNAQIRFTTDATGAVTGLQLEQSGGRINPARRVP
jgi:CubicO group peptidase (beta-lactamase class C family)